MTPNFAILPSDIIQCLFTPLNEQPCPNDTAGTNHQALRVLRLPHPRTNLPALFLPFKSSPSTPSVILEIQAVSPPDERSWIFQEDIVADGRMLMLTPVDPAFLLVPLLKITQPTDGTTAQFRTAVDILEAALERFQENMKADATQSTKASEAPPNFQIQDLLDFCALDCSKRAFSKLCEVKEITSEITVYRYTPNKFVEYLRLKVANLEQSAAFGSSQTIVRSLAKDGLMEDGKEDLLAAGRVKACCDLFAQYLPTDIHDLLLASYDLKALNEYTKANTEEMVKSAAVQPKKGKAKDNGKTVAGDKRKSTKASHGVEKLKKANVAGMAKLSSFFNKTK